MSCSLIGIEVTTVILCLDCQEDVGNDGYFQQRACRLQICFNETPNLFINHVLIGPRSKTQPSYHIDQIFQSNTNMNSHGFLLPCNVNDPTRRLGEQ
jgi:hypothetical protein